MFRATDSPIPMSTFLTVYPAKVTGRVTGRQQYRCIVPKAVYTVKKSASEDGRVCRPKHAELI